MYTNVTKSGFHDAFIRADRKENFSWGGRTVLFDYLEQLEEDCGTPIEFDVIALCRGYSEDTPEDIADYYLIDLSQCAPDDDDIRQTVLDYLQENTLVVGETDTTIVYQAF